MINIRHGIFETNSSSTHSISIAEARPNEVYSVMLPDKNGNIVLTGGEFGWEQETYNDAVTKANYMLVYADGWAGDNKEKFLVSLKEVIQEQTQCNEVIFQSEKRYEWSETPDFGYIDHQSVESSDYDYVFADKEKLKQFIFNRNSTLTTDNDNH